MKKLRKGTKFLFFILALLLLIIGYQFQEQIKMMKQPPSIKWGKEVYISKGKVTQNMQLMRYGEDYVALHNDDLDLKVLLFDSFGNVLKETLIKSEKMNRIYDFSLNLRDDNIYVNAIVQDEGVACLRSSKLDNNLELLECNKTPLAGIRSFYYIDESLFLTSSFPKRGTDDTFKINIHDWNKNTIESINIPADFQNMMGIKLHDGYAVVYSDNENFYYFTYNDGKISKPKAFLKYERVGISSYENLALASDNDNLYLMFTYMGTKVVQINLKNGIVSKNEFKNITKKEVLGFHSEDGGRFVYTEGYSNQAVDIIIKNGQIIEKNNISRLLPLNVKSYLCDEVAIFAKLERPDFYNIYVSSAGETYRHKNNVLRKVDIEMAMRRECLGITKVVTYLFTLGAICLFPLLGSACIYSLISYRLIRKNKVISYFVFSIIGGIIKAFVIYKYFYVSNLVYYGMFVNSTLGILVSIIISFSIYGYYSYNYKKDTEGIFVVRFLPPLLLDIFITLILFVPFTV